MEDRVPLPIVLACSAPDRVESTTIRYLERDCPWPRHQLELPPCQIARRVWGRGEELGTRITANDFVVQDSAYAYEPSKGAAFFFASAFAASGLFHLWQCL